MNYHDFRSVNTPAYVFSLDELSARILKIQNSLDERFSLVYAMKANPFIIGETLNRIHALEVCSPGEAAICEKSGIDGSRLILSGVNKERRHFEHYMDIYGDAPVYTAESVNQMQMLRELAQEKKLQIKLLLRLTSGNQFGMDQNTIEDIIRTASGCESLDIIGIQFYGGTQKRKKTILREIAALDDFVQKLRDCCSFSVRLLEYGPGLPVAYFCSEDDAIDDEYLTILNDALKGMRYDGPVSLEMGRYIAAYCGYYATSIVDMKTNDDLLYVIVDGGIHQLNYYGQSMAMMLPHILTRPDGDMQKATICGSLCTTADVLVRNADIPSPGIGDRLIFTRAGAYSSTEGISLFLCRDLPEIYLEKDGVLQRVRERIETADFII